jgi:hypothetical protein
MLSLNHWKNRIIGPPIFGYVAIPTTSLVLISTRRRLTVPVCMGEWLDLPPVGVSYP